MQRKAIVLLSGGLDSTTVLAMAKAEGFDLYTMSFNYGQRHRAELKAAEQIADEYGVKGHYEVKIPSFGGSALTDDIEVPKDRTDEEMANGIPVTYVPARNTIFLSFALGWADMLGAQHIFIGVNALDYSGYPDCRPEYIEAFEKAANLGIRGHVWIHAPLVHKTKAEIVHIGRELGVDYSKTVTCYDAAEDGTACGKCDACQLRARGFKMAGWKDPTRYAA